MDEYYVLVLWNSYCNDYDADRTYNGPYTLENAEKFATDMLVEWASECIICKKHSIKRKE